MTTTEIKRCERCDREMANDEDWAHVGNAYDANDELDCDRPRCREICWGQCQPVDWRARARAAEAVLADIREWLARIDGATVAPPGPTGDSDAARWRAKLESLIAAIGAAAHMRNWPAVDALLAEAAPTKEQG